MTKHNPNNERIKHKYLTFLKEAMRKSEPTVDKAASAIADFEQSTRFRDFKKFHVEQAQKYKRDLSERINPKTQKPLAVATQISRLMAVKAFVQWLADQPGYKSRIAYSDAEYFNLTDNEGRMAQTSRQKDAPTVDQIMQVLEAMPTEMLIERRDRALIAFTLLSGARDSAIISLSLKHVDFNGRQVFQDSREVKTKNRKTIHSFFFPVGEQVTQIVGEWIDELVRDHGFGPNDPLLPKTKVGRDRESESFKAIGIERAHWQSTEPVRRIFRQSFARAGLPYFHPHSFRRTLTTLGQQTCRTPEEFKAWSQNLGHEDVMTTFQNYGNVASNRQAEILRLIGPDRDKSDDDAMVQKIAQLFREQNERI